MPYEGPDDPGLPDRIKKMSKASREKWVAVWNSAYENCRKESTGGGAGGVSECEGTAFKFANAAVKELVLEESLKELEAICLEKQGRRNSALDESRLQQIKKLVSELLSNALDESDDGEKQSYGPKTWAEVDILEEKREVQQDFSSIVWSVMDDPILDNASKIALLHEAVSGLELRLKEQRGAKQVTKTEDGIEFQASDYAVVPDPEKPSTWKLRLAESKSGDFTVAQVARAITAMQPGGFRGQRVELSADDKKQAISRISAAIGKTGGDDTQKANLRERLDKVKERSFFAKIIDSLKGRHPSAESSNRLTFFKQADGSLRWFAWVTNHFRDDDNPPEIFESKAHHEYLSYLDKGGTMPEAWLWHTPGTRWGQTDWADYADGFLVLSGLADKGKESIADALSRMKGLKVSHGYKFRYSDEEHGIIGWYRTLEMSPLPGDAAANPWTGIEVVKKEAKEMFTETKRQFLVDVMGEAEVAALESRTSEMGKEIEALGVEYKDLDPEDAKSQLLDLVAEAVKAIKIPTAQDTAEAVIDSDGFKALAGTIAEVKKKADQVPGILERIKTLEKSDDEKIASALTARAVSGEKKGFRASEATKTEVKEDDPLSKAGPTGPDGWKDMFHGIAIGANVPADGARAS